MDSTADSQRRFRGLCDRNLSDRSQGSDASAGTARKSVSIVIPCYNAGRTMAETIESALQQNYGQLEIIVVDDGSTDDTLTIARRYEPAVRVITGENEGVSAARNKGADSCAGDAIIFLDSDDLLLSGSVQRRVDVMAKNDADVVICDWQDMCWVDGAWKDDKRQSVPMDELAPDPQIAIATSIWAPPAAILYSRRIVKRIGAFRTDLPIIQDARFLFDAAYNDARFVHSPHLGAKYRVAAQSLSRRDPSRFWLDVYANAQQIETLWSKDQAPGIAHREALVGIYRNIVLNLYKATRPEFSEALAHYNRLRGGSWGYAADRLWLYSATAWGRRPGLRSWLKR